MFRQNGGKPITPPVILTALCLLTASTSSGAETVRYDPGDTVYFT